MSIEDWLLSREGLSPEQIKALHTALEESVHTIANFKTVLDIAERELPRLKRTVATAENLLVTINAKQKEWQR